MMMGVTAFLHVKLDVEDLDRSLEFYCGRLAMRQVARYDRDDGVTLVQISPTGRPPGIELWYEPPWKALRRDRLHVALAVCELSQLVEALRRQGVAIEREAFRIGHELIAFIRDPDGYLIELNEDLG